MNEKNVLLIGLGPHAKRIHLPIIQRDGKCLNAKIVVIIDLLSQKRPVLRYLEDEKICSANKPELILLSRKQSVIKNNNLSSELIKILNELVKRHRINAVFICTEPSSHVAYAKWALLSGLCILMDKPISTPINLATSMKAVNQLQKDYYLLLDLYNHQKIKNPNLIFELMTQRRYHAAFIKIRDLVVEVAEKTGTPITSFQTTHNDGQWRMPSEIVDQDYHPYNQGYGKCSHSGYHSIDIIDWLIRQSILSESQKTLKLEVTSNFSYPADFITQIPLKNYKSFFNSNDPMKYAEKQLKKLYNDYGEIDAQIGVCYKNNKGRTITIGQFSLLHNSFSQRNWPNTKDRDLYKGNGRIRHEIHYLTQGPFQTIIFESLQSEEILNESTNNSDVGGEYHLDVHVFRNSKLFPQWKSYEKFTMNDLSKNILKGYSRGHQEDARRSAIITFLKSIDRPSNLRNSPIEDQQESINLLSAIYKSALLRKRKKNSVVVVNVRKSHERKTD